MITIKGSDIENDLPIEFTNLIVAFKDDNYFEPRVFKSHWRKEGKLYLSSQRPPAVYHVRNKNAR
jgi:hypothetical protein